MKQAPVQLEQRPAAIHKPSTDVSVENASSTLRTLRFRAVAYAGEQSIDSRFCAETKLEDVLRMMLVDANKVFDDVLLASEDGDVLYQDARSESRLIRLDRLVADASKNSKARETAPPARKQSQPPTSEPKSDASTAPAAPASPGQFAQSSDFSNLHEVHFAGEDYLVFIQPSAVAHVSAGGSDSAAKLLMVGLLRQSRVSKETAELPMNFLAWALLLFSLSFSIAWALSSLNGKPQLVPMRSFDIVLVAFVAVITVALLTIGIIHAYTSESLDIDTVDERLHSLAKRVDTNVQEELTRLAHLLHAMTRSATFDQAFHASKSAYSENGEPMKEKQLQADLDRCCVLKNVLGDGAASMSEASGAANSRGPVEPRSPEITSIAYSFPFFDYVFWSNLQGSQIAKFSIRKDVTPPTPMLQFRWFSDILEGRAFQLALEPNQQQLVGCDTARLLVQPLYSPNTGEYLTVIAAPVAHGQSEQGVPVIANDVCHASTLSSQVGAGLVVAPLASVNSPIFPPRYGFVIIEQTGKVLYSSMRAPKSRENFFRDCQDDPRVMQRAMITDASDVTVTYRGNPARVHMAPFQSLRGAPWTIVTWHDLTQDRHAELDTLGKSLLLMIPHAMLMALLAFLAWRRLRVGSANAFWPNVEDVGRYVGLVQILVGASVYLWLLALTGSRGLVYFGMLTLPPGVAFTVVALLCNRMTAARILISTFLIAALVNLYQRSTYSRPSDLALTLLGLILLVAVWNFSPCASNARRVVSKWKIGNRRLTDYWLYLYAGIIGTALLVIAVIPAVATYRIAYDSVRTTQTMRDLVDLSRALDARARSAEEYYRDIQLASGVHEQQRFIADRLSSTLDRYDLAMASRETPREIVTARNASLSRLDRILNQLGLAIVPVGKSDELGFSSPNPDVIQYNYPAATVATELGSNGADHLKTHRVASRLVSLTHISWTLWCVGLALVVIVYKLILSTVRFLFLLDVEAPKTLATVAISDLPKRKDNLVLLGLFGTGKSRRLRATANISYLDMCTAPTSAQLTAISDMARPVVIDHFDVEWTSESDEMRLSLLEWLLYEKGRTVILLCVRDPMQYRRDQLQKRTRADAAPETATLSSMSERWNRLWRRFPHVAVEDCPIRVTEQEVELEWTRRIYASCTRAQRALLYYLAREGWINPKNRHAAGELVSRGLLQLKPFPGFPESLMWITPNIRRVVPKEDPEQWKSTAKGTSPLSVLMWVLGICVAGLILFVGRDYIQSWVGLLGGVFTALATLWKLISEMRTRSARVDSRSSDVVA